MKKIPVVCSHDGVVYALVDDEDFNMLAGYAWHVHRNGKGGRGVGTMISYIGVDRVRKYKRVQIHHAIIGQPPIGMDVHHINGDPLDNRKENLEIISSLEHAYISSRQGFDREDY